MKLALLLVFLLTTHSAASFFCLTMSFAARQKFTHVQPEDKLGTQHASLEAFGTATSHFTPTKEKKYTLVLVTEPARKRILLGKKLRGFGQGFYNSFGGKIEAHETEEEGARRELEEETGIAVPLHIVANAKVGVLYFTFDDSPTKMTVHLYRINVDTTSSSSSTPTTTATTSSNHNKANANTSSSPSSSSNKELEIFNLDPSVIRGCDEITPLWFDDWYQIPLDTMFADDSVWLTRLLEQTTDAQKLCFDGYFHFYAGGQETNQIMHYFLDDKTTTAAAASANAGATTSLPNSYLKGRSSLHTRMSLSYSKYHCIQCLQGTESLYQKYSTTSFKLSVCTSCGSDVDPYIEREDFLVAMDIVLLRRDAYRHLLLNRTEAFDVWGDLASAFQYFMASCALQAYLLWEDCCKQTDISSNPAEWDGQGQAIVSLFLMLLLKIVLQSLALCFASFRCLSHFSRAKTPTQRLLSRVFLAQLIPSFFTVVTIFVMVWENTQTIRLLGCLQIFTYQVISIHTIGSVERLTLGEFVIAVLLTIAISTAVSISLSNLLGVGTTTLLPGEKLRAYYDSFESNPTKCVLFSTC